MTLSIRRRVAGFSCALVLLVAAEAASAQDPARRVLRDPRSAPAVPDRASARLLVEEHRAELGLGSGSLSEGRTTEAGSGARLRRAHHFEQAFAGIPVEDSDVVVLTRGDGSVLLVEAKVGSDVGADPVPRIGASDAVRAVLAQARGGAPGPESDAVASLVFRREGFGQEPEDRIRLYWRVEIQAGGDGVDGLPLGRVAWVDAGSREARIAYQSATVCGGDTEIQYVTNHLPPGDAGATYALAGQPDVEVMFFCAWGGTAGPVISGPGGTFAVPAGFTCVDPQLGAGAINVLGRYGSVMPDINLWQGYGPLPALGAAAGGGPGPGPYVHPTGSGVIFPGGVTMNPICPGAAGQVLYWHRVLRDWVASHPILGGATIDAEVDVPAFSLVAMASPANGLWRVRFGAPGTPAGGSTPLANSASSTIILHELGHICWFLTTPAGVWWNPDSKAVNEAVGDTIAMFITGQPLVGLAWQGAGTGALRAGTNGQGYAALDPEGNEHQNGEILMGSFWTMRQNLVASLGAANGSAAAKDLLLDWLVLFDDVDMDSSILAHLLVLDDDDGDLTNGTPNDAAIAGGFAAHDWPASDPALYGSGSAPIFGAKFFDLDAGTGRLSKLALFVFDPAISAAPVVIVAGTPGSAFIPGLGVTAFDVTLPILFLVDGITPGAGILPLFPASTAADGVFRHREPIVPAWPPGVLIAMQALVLDAAAPFGFRMSNGFSVALP
jgi:hypothetical protein